MHIQLGSMPNLLSKRVGKNVIDIYVYVLVPYLHNQQLTLLYPNSQICHCSKFYVMLGTELRASYIIYIVKNCANWVSSWATLGDHVLKDEEPGAERPHGYQDLYHCNLQRLPGLPLRAPSPCNLLTCTSSSSVPDLVAGRVWQVSGRVYI